MALDREPTARECARALWLLGLTSPEGVEEVRAAWKARVAQSHPDRRSDRPHAATRLTAAFNDARDVLERWSASGRAWPAPRRSRRDESDGGGSPVRRPDARAAELLRVTGLRSGDAVRVGDRGPVRDVAGLEVGDGGIAVTLDDGSVHHPRELVPVGYACPVCGHFEPPLEPVRRRPCTACLRELSRLDQSDTGVDRALGSVLARAEDAIKHARGLEGAPVMELARERAGWVRRLRRRPREERPGALLAAFAHAYALWAGMPGSPPASDGEGTPLPERWERRATATSSSGPRA